MATIHDTDEHESTTSTLIWTAAALIVVAIFAVFFVI